MILPVLYHSQFHAVNDPEWKSRACSVTCLAMVLAYLAPKIGGSAPAVNALIKEGQTINAIDSARNWTHVGIVRLAHNHGVHAYSQEFRSLDNGEPSRHEPRMVKEGIEKIVQTIEAGFPVIASVKRGFTAEGTAHTVVVVGTSRDSKGVLGGFVVHDPDSEMSPDGEGKTVDIDTFLKGWRKLAIFFH